MSRLRKLAALTVPALLVTAAGLEIVFRTVIPAQELPQRRWDHGVLRWSDEPDSTGIWSAGLLAQARARWHINDDGWNSLIDYAAADTSGQPLVAVIGDSFVEGFHVPTTRNFAAVMDSLTPGVRVYPFGHQGAPLSQYLQMIRYVENLHEPDALVISLWHNDFEESLRSLASRPYFLQIERTDDSFRELEVLPYESWFLSPILRRSATARYLYINAGVGAFLGALRRAHHADTSEPGGDESGVQRHRLLTDATTWLIRRILEENTDLPILFVLDAPRPAMYDGRLNADDTWDHRMIRTICEDLGCEFLDLTPIFMRLYSENGLRFETPYDFHWNGYGHGVVAGAVLTRLTEMGVLPGGRLMTR